LFRQDQFEQAVSTLFGGERMRLLLAKLLLQGANVILLDEPTNDLDLMTLRILEEALIAFDGASIVISHDRALLDRACTAVLAFEGHGRVIRYASRLQAIEAVRSEPEEATPNPAPKSRTKTEKKGLTWKEQKELDGLPEKLEKLEGLRDRLGAQLSDPKTYQDASVDAAEISGEFKATEQSIADAYSRWEYLESKGG
jgi:ATP-binding cassette subfamily F protein uup